MKEEFSKLAAKNTQKFYKKLRSVLDDLSMIEGLGSGLADSCRDFHVAAMCARMMSTWNIIPF